MPSSHDATASLLGYLAQCRYALLLALGELKRNPSHEISIERFDDIAFAESGTPLELVQTKHHTTPGDVSDFGEDIWKTLRIWIDKVKGDPDTAARTRFVFLTTASVTSGSALEALRTHEGTRDTIAASDRLLTAANNSTNTRTETARREFTELDPSLRDLMLSNAYVFDNAPDIINVRDKIEAELLPGAPLSQISPYTDRVEGWWFARVITSLSDESDRAITLNSLMAKLSEIRDDFRSDSLPLSADIDNLEFSTITADDNRTFVRQMKLVQIEDGSANRAVHDYYKAFTQRSKWAREELLLDDEAKRYDAALQDAFERESDAVNSETTLACEDDNCKVGQRLFHWSRRMAKPLRNRHEQWLPAGSFQILSDRCVIGWHPNYLSELDDEEKKG